MSLPYLYWPNYQVSDRISLRPKVMFEERVTKVNSVVYLAVAKPLSIYIIEVIT